MSNTNTQTRKILIANLSKYFPQATKADWAKANKDELIWLAELATHLETRGRGMSETLLRYRTTYQPSICYSGRKSLNNGDAIADFLSGLAPDEVLSQAERILGLDTGFLTEKYQNLNEGQKRMNGGNRLRSALKRGDITEADLLH